MKVGALGGSKNIPLISGRVESIVYRKEGIDGGGVKTSKLAPFKRDHTKAELGRGMPKQRRDEACLVPTSVWVLQKNVIAWMMLG